MNNVRLIRAGLTLVMLVAFVACSRAASPGSTPGQSHGTGPIEHPTGATDVVLRYEEGGGFVAPGFLLTEAPWFTLYGDGTAIFRDPHAPAPQVVGEIVISAPFFTTRLTEEQVQTLLEFAIAEGGLGRARESYELPVADAPTTVFTLDAGGFDRRVSVNGLGIGVLQSANPDNQALAKLAALRTRLAGFASMVDGEQPWAPDRYRGILVDNVSGGGAQGVPWPWPGIKVSDFTRPGDPNGPAFPTRVMSPADVAALGVAHLDGGAMGFLLNRPAGTAPGLPYRFALRVLLPDEAR